MNYFVSLNNNTSELYSFNLYNNCLVCGRQSLRWSQWPPPAGVQVLCEPLAWAWARDAPLAKGIGQRWQPGTLKAALRKDCGFRPGSSSLPPRAASCQCCKQAYGEMPSVRTWILPAILWAWKWIPKSPPQVSWNETAAWQTSRATHCLLDITIWKCLPTLTHDLLLSSSYLVVSDVRVYSAWGPLGSGVCVHICNGTVYCLLCSGIAKHCTLSMSFNHHSNHEVGARFISFEWETWG